MCVYCTGINEDLPGSLRMLACAYPTYFRSIARMLKTARRHHKPSSQSAEMRAHENLSVVSESCQRAGDDTLYAAAKRLMIAKLKRIEQDRSSCCRTVVRKKKTREKGEDIEEDAGGGEM